MLYHTYTGGGTKGSGISNPLYSFLAGQLNNWDQPWRQEHVGKARQFAPVDEAHACLSDFALEDTFVAGVAEQADIHRAGTVEEVLERNVADPPRRIPGGELLYTGTKKIALVGDSIHFAPGVESAIKSAVDVLPCTSS